MRAAGAQGCKLTCLQYAVQWWNPGLRPLPHSYVRAASTLEAQYATQVCGAASASFWWRLLHGEAAKRIPGEHSRFSRSLQKCSPFSSKPHKHIPLSDMWHSLCCSGSASKGRHSAQATGTLTVCTCLDPDFWHLQVQQGEQAQRRV